MASQSKEISVLWNNLLLDAYKPEFFGALGLMDKKDIRSLEKAYCSETDIPILSPDSYIPIPFQSLPKMIERLPFLKNQLDFLYQASLPLQIKMLEDGKKIALSNVQNSLIENIQKQIDSAEFRTNMNLRWQVYLSNILNTIAVLRDTSSLKQCHNLHFIPDFLKARKRAAYLDTKLRHLLKGTGKYFLSSKTDSFTQKNEKVKTAYSTLSKLFGDSASIMTKKEILAKEKDVLKLFSDAVNWKNQDKNKEKTNLDKSILEWAKELEKIESDEKHSDLFNDGKNTTEDAKPVNSSRRARLDYIEKNETYSSLEASQVYFSLFFRLGLINKKGLELMEDRWNEYLDWQPKKEDSDEDFDDSPEEDDETREDVYKEEVSFSLYEKESESVLQKIAKEVQDKKYSNDFDLETCVHILRKTEPLFLLKAIQLRDFEFEEKTAEDVKFNIKKFQKPLNRFDDYEKMNSLALIVGATIQDLRDDGTKNCIKDAKNMCNELDCLLEGVPEYWFNFFMERFNYYYAKTDNPATVHSAKVLLDNMVNCFNCDTNGVSKENISHRLSGLKDLANRAVYLNPKWTETQKDNFWHGIFQMTRPRVVKNAERPHDEGKQNTHE